MDDLRGAQFRSATPRTSVAQHKGLESNPVQTGALWRIMAGVAMVTEAPVRRAVRMVENCIFERWAF